ncbi:MAG: aspartate kinase [Armatimonadetes bacterium]|nr:aspartate kinase [Armatimonadota bacterium]MDE2205914.1 aspartate kinase [Armatimonadota bacterium]
MKILVQKFGGTSLDSQEHREMAVRKVIQAQQAGHASVVVVSAIGRSGAPYATDSLIGFLEAVDPQAPMPPRELDVMMGCGEIISAAVFARALQASGIKASALTGGQAGIITDEVYGNARIREIRTQHLLSLLRKGITPVVCGFQGATDHSEEDESWSLTTLGRGGSDTTATALGAALKATAVEIYTDVDGVKSADPDLVPDARTLDVCSYEEVAEIAHQGARVVHPRAVEIAMDHRMPLWVKGTFTESPGTRIESIPNRGAGAPRVTGVTHTGKIVFIRLEIGETVHKASVEREVYRMMSRAGVNIHYVTFGPNALSFGVPRDKFPIARDLLDGMVVPVPYEAPDSSGKVAAFFIFKFSEGLDLAYSVQRPLLRAMESKIDVVDVPGAVFENCTTVSVVTSGHRRVPGIMAGVFETLAGAGVAVYQTADSEMSVSFLVPESDAERAVRLLHARFCQTTAA